MSPATPPRPALPPVMPQRIRLCCPSRNRRPTAHVVDLSCPHRLPGPFGRTVFVVNPKRAINPALHPLEPRRLLSTYYVSPTGDDTAPGTLDQPWRTVARA